MPLSDGLRRAEQLGQTEPRYPLDVAFCHDCSLVQITKTVPADEMFCCDYPYYSSFSDYLLEHSKANAQCLMASRGLNSDSLVVELASNDGYMLQNFTNENIPVLGIDPAEGPVKVAMEKGIHTLKKFFTKDLAEQLRDEGMKADVILANNVLAYVPDLNGFVAGIGTLLKDDGVAVIECPYVKDLIDHCEFDTIYHEHLCYYSVTALSKLFARHNLSLNRVEHYPIHGGSLRLFVEKRANIDDTVKIYLANEKESKVDELSYYTDFASSVSSVRTSLQMMLHNLKDKGKKVAAYGAAAKGAIMLNYAKITPDTIDFVVDLNIHKQGKYMPGVDIPICDPSRILEDMPDYVLLLPWNFKDEILKQQHEYRSRGGRFIIPIPHPTIV
jgi:SAM-dependent methyltransferase